MPMPKSSFPPAAIAEKKGRLHSPEAFRFRAGGEIKFVAEEGKKGRWMMKGYSGVPFYHPYWGMTAVELSSLKIQGQKKPILREHMPTAIVGYSEKIEKSDDKGVELEGIFSDVTADGREVAGLAAEGFPWEASIRFNARTREWVGEGEEATVNGRKLRGPGVILRDAYLQEVSFCAVGADPNTKARMLSADAESLDPEEIIAAFSVDGGGRNQKEAEMPDEKKTEIPPSVTTYTAADVEAHEKAARQKALDEERGRAKSIREFADPCQGQLAQELIDSGAAVTEAQAKLHADLRQKFSARREALSGDPAAGLRSSSTQPPAKSAAEMEKEKGGKFAPGAEADLILGHGRINEAKAKELFAASADLQVEFASESEYLAYLQAESRGGVMTAAPPEIPYEKFARRR